MDQLSRKRLRNRLAQQKYSEEVFETPKILLILGGQKLKQRIKDLEQAAASTALPQPFLSSESNPELHLSYSNHEKGADSLSLSTRLVPYLSATHEEHPVRATFSTNFDQGFDFSDASSQEPTFENASHTDVEANVFRNKVHSSDESGLLNLRLPSTFKTLRRESYLPSPTDGPQGRPEKPRSRPISPFTTLSDTTKPRHVPGSENISPDRSQEAAIHSIIDFTKSLGFESLDEVFKVYYTTSFHHGSAMYNTQRSSRNRELPGLLRLLRDTSARWTQWEANGYKNETVRSTEQILVTEINSFLESIADKSDEGGMSPQDYSSAAPSFESLPYIEKDLAESFRDCKLDDELPNTWAILRALTSYGSLKDRAERHSLLLATVSLLLEGV